MTLFDLLPSVRRLSRAEKAELIHVLAQDLVEPPEASLMVANQTYSIWSPDRAYDAAAVLLHALESEGSAK